MKVNLTIKISATLSKVIDLTEEEYQKYCDHLDSSDRVENQRAEEDLRCMLSIDDDWQDDEVDWILEFEPVANQG